jgi:hypothetical protein
LAGIHYECKIMHSVPMLTPKAGAPIHSFYTTGDFHTMYFAEIVACYETE